MSDHAQTFKTGDVFRTLGDTERKPGSHSACFEVILPVIFEFQNNIQFVGKGRKKSVSGRAHLVKLGVGIEGDSEAMVGRFKISAAVTVEQCRL